MQKRSMLTRAANWQLSFLYQIRRFQNRNLGCNFQTLLARKRGLAHPFFLYENEPPRYYLNPWGLVFPRSALFFRSWVPVRVRFLDDAQNDEQFQKLQKKSKSTFTWDPKWTQTGLRFYFGVKFHLGVR